MKLAIASNNGITIQRHFGQTTQFVIATIDGSGEVARENRPTEGHTSHTEDHDHQHHRHGAFINAVADCDVLVANGMGIPMARATETSGMQLILTNERLVDDIINSYIAGTLEHHPELAHQPGH